MKIEGYISEIPKKAIKALSTVAKVTLAGLMISHAAAAFSQDENAFNEFQSIGSPIPESGFTFDTNTELSSDKMTLETEHQRFSKFNKSTILEVMEDRQEYLSNKELVKTNLFLQDQVSNMEGVYPIDELSEMDMINNAGRFLHNSGVGGLEKELYLFTADDRESGIENYSVVVLESVERFNESFNMNHKQQMAQNVTINDFYKNAEEVTSLDNSYNNSIEILKNSDNVNDTVKYEISQHIDNLGLYQMSRMIDTINLDVGITIKIPNSDEVENTLENKNKNKNKHKV